MELSFSTLQRGPLSFSKTSNVSVIRSVYNVYRTNAEARHIALTLIVSGMDNTEETARKLKDTDKGES